MLWMAQVDIKRVRLLDPASESGKLTSMEPSPARCLKEVLGCFLPAAS